MRFIGWVLLLVVPVGAALYGVNAYRHRFVRSNADLVKLLPPGDLTVFFADLSAMRQAGVLRLLAGVRPAGEQEYGQFVSETQFDFARDLSAMAGAVDGDRLYFVGRGHFDWDKLQAYAVKHGGTCRDDSCRQPGSTPGKWADFVRVQPDVIALAVSGDRTAADLLRPPGRRLQAEIPAAPLWVTLSHALRVNPSALPAPLQMFAIDVQSASELVLAVEPVQSATDAFEIRLHGEFENAAAADTARVQLEMQTRALKAVLLKDDPKADAASLTALITGGWFHSAGTQLTGGWPVRKELLAVLQ